MVVVWVAPPSAVYQGPWQVPKVWAIRESIVTVQLTKAIWRERDRG